MSIRVEHLTKRFGAFHAVDDVSFEVEPGELVGLLGPSGGGKSTVLRIIAGLERADEGSVYLDGERVDQIEARERGVGFVFQHYALFRHMSVEKNIAFGLDVQRVSPSESAARVKELLGLMGLTGLEKRYPAQLSGGQRQRVALARALAPKPRLLLLDEPFSAVDARVREELRRWLRRMHDEVHVTSIFVTHDQEEAFALSDRVLLIHKGRLEQAGAPADIFDRPASEFVARFVGDVNILDAVAEKSGVRAGALTIPSEGHAPGEKLSAVVRCYDLKFWQADDGIATVTRVLPLGDRVKVEAKLDDGSAIFAQFPRRSSLLRGVERGVRIQIEVTLARLYPRGAIPGAE